MKLKLQLTSGISLAAIATVILLITSPAIAVPTDTSTIGTNNYATTPNVEMASVTGGIGQSVYASLYTFGGVDGSTITLDTSANAFANARTWFVASISQTGFDSYLQRAPSPVFAPDGLSLHIAYPASTGQTTALNQAFDASAAVEAEYGVDLTLQSYNPDANQFMFWANGSNVASVHGDVAAQVTDLGSVGFASVLDASTITSAPVFWSGFGARTLAGSDVVQFGAGWVDADGIEDDGNGQYTLSSQNVFGAALNPNSQTAASLSRVTFNFPYPIEPIANGFSVPTSNPLPHVTGVAEWDLRHPIAGYGIGGQSDLSVTFELKDDNAFPNVQNTFSVDQTKLETEGILEANFNIKNTGTEAAENVDVLYPLGPDFGKIAGNKSIYVINDTYQLDPSVNVEFSAYATVDNEFISLTELFNEVFLDFSGWYDHVSNGSIADWDNNTDTLVAFNGQVSYSGVVSDVVIEINSNNGFPTFLVDLVNNVLGPALTGVSSYSELTDALYDAMPQVIRTTLNQTVETYYDKQQIFIVQTGDFQLESFEYQNAADQTSDYYYMYSTGHNLSVNAEKDLKFRITNVPVEADKFQFLDYNFTASTGAGDLPQATIVSYEEDWFSVMQYFFQASEYDGRPLSYQFDASVSFGLDAMNLDSFHGEQYVSHGAWVRYENTQGFPFFSLSNGQNLQIADDEAVVSGVVSLDQQVYYPGDTREITVELSNTGSIPAGDVKVHLYEASLGRGWSFDRAQKISTLTLDGDGSLAANSNATLTHNDVADSYVGYSPVYAYIEFDSDVGQDGQELRDYLGLGIDNYEAAGETHHITFSTLTGSLLLPAPGDVDLNPTIKEPKVDISKTVSEVDGNNQVTVTYTVENTGEADTTVYFAQPYSTAELDLVSSSDLTSAIKIENTYPDYDFGYVSYGQIQLDVGESVTIEFVFELLAESATLDPAWAYFTFAGDSTLGSGVDTGTSTSVGSAMLGLSAGSQAQEDSQKSANENGASSSYSASSSLGASVNTNINTDQTNTVAGIGFLGYDAIGFLALMAVPMTLAAFIKKRR